MNKIDITFRALSCIVSLFTGSIMINAATGNISKNQSVENTAIVNESTQEIDTVSSTDSKVSNSKKEEKQQTEDNPKPSSNSSSSSQTPQDSGPTGHTTVPDHSTPEPPKPAYNPTVKQYNNLAEWEADVMGVCPSQRPAYAQTSYKSYLPAIGISGLGQRNTPNRAVDLTWNDMKIYGASNTGALGTYGMIIGDRSCSNDNYSFKIDWHSNTVEWYMTWGGDKSSSGSMQSTLDNLASQMTQRLRWVDSTYRNKCPNN